MHKIALVTCCVAALSCGSCADVVPATVPTDVPGAFEQSAASPGDWPSRDWYQGFASAELVSLIELAQQNNFDLAAAAARVRQADARARAAGAAILPEISAGAEGAHYRGGSHGRTASETDWSALVSASYEVDFWGRNRANARSAQFAALASRADRDTVALTILAGVADGYFQLLSLRERLQIATASLDETREVMRAIEARYHAGAAAPQELASQRAAVASAEAQIPRLQQQEIEARAALALLVGRAPENFEIESRKLDGLTAPEVAPGIPSELLTRRPDVFVAEADLQAAHADVAAARAALFPSLALTGSAGVQDPAVQAAVVTLEGTGYSLTLGASLVQTVFDRGRRRAQRDAAVAREEELLANYRAAILHALRDVETALSAVGHLDRQLAAQTENVAQSERAYEGARLRYQAGAGDYLGMLDAHRTLYAARDELSQTRLAQLHAVVSLCKALGGGWTGDSSAS